MIPAAPFAGLRSVEEGGRRIRRTLNFVKPTLARAVLRPHFSKRIVARAVTLPAYLSKELTKRVFKINKSAQPGKEEEEEEEGRALGFVTPRK